MKIEKLGYLCRLCGETMLPYHHRTCQKIDKENALYNFGLETRYKAQLSLIKEIREDLPFPPFQQVEGKPNMRQRICYGIIDTILTDKETEIRKELDKLG